jgi:hypothetical protein
MSFRQLDLISLSARLKQWVSGVLHTRLRRRIAIVCFVILIVGISSIGAAVGLLMWRLSEGPIRLEVIDSTIETAVARQLGDVTVDIVGAELFRESDGSMAVRLTDVVIRDKEGQFLARAPEAVVATRFISAAFGLVVPTRIELIGPHITIHRSQAGNISFGFRGPPADDISVLDAVETLADTSLVGTESVLVSAATEPAKTAKLANVDTQNTALENLSLSLISNLASNSGFMGTVDRLLVRRARLTLFDEASQSLWDSHNTTLHITRSDGGLSVFIDAPFSTDSGDWWFRSTLEKSGPQAPLLIDAEFDSVVPSEIVARIESLAEFSGFDMPVSGHFKANISPEGYVDSVSGDVRLGTGFLRHIPFLNTKMMPYLVDEARVAATYKRVENKLDISHFSVQVGSSRASLSGTLAPELGEEGDVVAARFDLRSENLTFLTSDQAPPIIINRALASGRMMMDRSRLEIDTISAEFPQGRFTFGVTATFEPEQAVAIQGTLEDIPVASLMQIWPRLDSYNNTQKTGSFSVVNKTREWLKHNITDGVIRDGVVQVMLSSSDFEEFSDGNPFPDNTINIELNLADITADYLDPLPPLEQASGAVIINADSVILSLDKGIVHTPGGEVLTVNKGRFEVPMLEKNDFGYLDGKVALEIAGPTSASLEFLSLKPLQFTSEIGFDISKVSGQSELNVDLVLPLVNDVPFSKINYEVGAIVRDLAIQDAFGDITLKSSELQIIATPKKIDAEGNVFLNGLPAKAKWEIMLDQPGGLSNRLQLATAVDAENFGRLGKALGRVGEKLDDYWQGKMPIHLEATGQGFSLNSFVINADVTNSHFQVPAIGWSKPVGSAAQLNLNVEMLPNNQVRISEIVLSGKDINLEGALRLDPDCSLYKADISRLRLGQKADLSLNGLRGDDGVFSVTVKGRNFDASELLRREIEGQASRQADDLARPTTIDYQIDAVRGADNIPLNGARGQIRMDKGLVVGVQLDGQFTEGQIFQLNFDRGGGNVPALVNIEASDAGEFVRFFGLYKRAYGGAMILRAQGPDERSLVGTIEAHNFSIRDEPVLSQIAQTISGLAEETARDFKFSRLRLDFERRGGILDIKDALIGGPAVGVTIRGTVDIAGEELGLSGTYIPAYGLNTVFSGIPLVGPILSGRSGEGIFGMTFEVAGRMENPTIKINPMSTIAPGLLRRLFEFRPD